MRDRPAASVTLHEGDCIAVMADLPAASFDAIVTDPPYHLTSIVKRFGGEDAAEAKAGSDGLFQRSAKGFMGKTWDGGDIAFRTETWAACLRLLKPGGHLVAFSAARTYPHMALAIERAGFEARDSILSLYSASDAWRGFLDGLEPDQVAAFSRAMAASDAPLLAWLYGCGFPKSHDVGRGIDKLLGAAREPKRIPHSGNVMMGGIGAKRPWSDAARENGYHELPGDTPASSQAAEWDGWGTALKPAWEPIVLARKPLAAGSVARQVLATGTGALNIAGARTGDDVMLKSASTGTPRASQSNSMGAQTDRDITGSHVGRWPANVTTDGSAEVLGRFPVDPEGSVARFFYSAKADAQDRAGSPHPTVKPQDLMRWLLRLVTPRGGRVLDPFGGSGATGWAAAREGFTCDLIERDPGYAAHIRTRITGLGVAAAVPNPATAAPQLDMFGA